MFKHWKWRWWLGQQFLHNTDVKKSPGPTGFPGWVLKAQFLPVWKPPLSSLYPTHQQLCLWNCDQSLGLFTVIMMGGKTLSLKPVHATLLTGLTEAQMTIRQRPPATALLIKIKIDSWDRLQQTPATLSSWWSEYWKWVDGWMNGWACFERATTTLVSSNLTLVYLKVVYWIHFCIL